LCILHRAIQFSTVEAANAVIAEYWKNNNLNKYADFDQFGVYFRYRSMTYRRCTRSRRDANGYNIEKNVDEWKKLIKIKIMPINLL
jgi:hypothetical protein